MNKSIRVSILMTLLLFFNVSLYPQSNAKILIVYYSMQGHTELMAKAVKAGAEGIAGTSVRCLKVTDAKNDDVKWADAIIIGSPVYNAQPAPEIQSFNNSLPFDGSMRDKIGAAFVSAGGISAGEELVQLSILHSMLMFGMVIVGGSEWTNAFGASAVTDEAPFITSRDSVVVNKLFLDKASSLGKRVANAAIRWKK
jgi:NAD(P)H dehydrogenase (quinone)